MSRDKINLAKMVDVCGGDMTLDEVLREVRHYTNYYSEAERLVVVIGRRDTGDLKYPTTIYIPKKSFGKNND